MASLKSLHRLQYQEFYFVNFYFLIKNLRQSSNRNTVY